MLPMLSLQYLELEDGNYSGNGASEAQLWSNTSCGGSFIWEKTFQKKHLPYANHQKNEGFSYWPIGHSCI